MNFRKRELWFVFFLYYSFRVYEIYFFVLKVVFLVGVLDGKSGIEVSSVSLGISEYFRECVLF